MKGQMDFFSDYGLEVIEGGKDDIMETSEANELLKCFKSELVSVETMTLDELFSGFDTIKAITFSYDISFIDDIMGKFRYGEILLGADFIVQKDTKINNFLVDFFTNAYEVGRLVKNYDNIAQLLSDGGIDLRVPKTVLDHRKIYLLKADNGRTRVIKASANMTKAAWNNDHMEHYEYDDTLRCYEEYEKDFDAVWRDSESVTKDVVFSKKSDNLIDGNPILKKIVEMNRVVVLHEPETDNEIEDIKYVVDFQNKYEQYKEIMNSVSVKAKNGLIEFSPKMVEKMKYNQKKLEQKNVKITQVIKIIRRSHLIYIITHRF